MASAHSTPDHSSVDLPTCRYCGSFGDVRLRHSRWWEILTTRVLNLRRFRCLNCDLRFWARFSAPD